MPQNRSPAAPRWAHRLRRALTGALWLVALWWFGGWLWDQPFMERPRMLWQINRMDAPVALPVPVQGLAARRIADICLDISLIACRSRAASRSRP